MSRNKGFSRLTKFLQPPKLVDGIFEVSLRLKNFSEGIRRKEYLRNGMWNGVRNGIIMRNTIYPGNKLTEERILFSRQFYKSSSFFDVTDY